MVRCRRARSRYAPAMSEHPGSEQGDSRGEEPRIDLSKQRGAGGGSRSGGEQPSAYPPPPVGPGWGSTPPPPPPGHAPPQGSYPPGPQGYYSSGPQGSFPPPPGSHPQQQGGYPPPWQGHPGQAVGSRLSPADERLWAGAAHWSAIVAMVVALAFLGPLLVLLLKGNESPFVRRQAAESLNFQITILVAALVSGVLLVVGIGFLLLPLVGLAWLVFTVIGAVKASSGEDYRYPFALRLVS